MSRILLVLPLSPAHNDSCVDGVAATPCHACYLPQRKESRYEDPPPHDPVTSTYARRHGDPHLSTPSPPAARLQEHLYPDRLCPAVFVRNHVRAPLDGRLHPVP